MTDTIEQRIAREVIAQMGLADALNAVALRLEEVVSTASSEGKTRIDGVEANILQAVTAEAEATRYELAQAVENIGAKVDAVAQGMGAHDSELKSLIAGIRSQIEVIASTQTSQAQTLAMVAQVVQALSVKVDQLVAGTPPVEPEEPGPVDPEEPEEPVKNYHETSIREYVNDNWNKGVWITDARAGFLIPADPANIANFYIGQTVVMANGEERTITYVATSGSNTTVLLDGPSLADIVDQVGNPHTLKVELDGELPEPVPVPELGHGQKINAFTDSVYWNKGIFRTKAGFSIPYSAENEAAFTKGVNVEFEDTQVRTITSVQFVGDNMSVWVSGGLLDPLTVGAPRFVYTTDAPVFELPYSPPVVEPTPEPEPVEPVEPGTYSGRVGINLGLGMGAEHVNPGRHMSEYRYPQLSEWQKVAADGFVVARVGFLWERLIRGGVGGTLSMDDIRLMHKCAADAKSVGMSIMWDMHNYSGYGFGPDASNSLRDKIGTTRVPTNALGDDWRRIAEALMADPVCAEVTEGFDVMNEPIISWAAWRPALQHCINMIAQVAPDKYVACEGIAYSSTKNWVALNPGMENVTHPNGKQFLRFHGHYYLDLGSDGFWKDAAELADQIDPMTGVNGVQSFKNWLKDNGYEGQGAIGETMVPGIYPNSVAALDNFMHECLSNGIDVFPFFSAYGAGNNWHNIYKPENAPSLAVIKKYSMAQ